MTPVADSIITTLRLYPSLRTTTLINIEINHGYERAAVMDALADLVLIKRVAITGDSLSLIAKPWDEDEIPAASFAAADSYRQKHCPTWGDRAAVLIANLWASLVGVCDRVVSWFRAIRDRIMGGLVLLIVTVFFTLGLCASEPMPAWVLAGIMDRESSSYRNGALIVYVNQAEGDAGELGPFQMRRAAFDQVATSGERFEQLASDPAFAEDLAIRYLHWLRARQPSWFDAVGRYNTGLRGHYPTAWRYAKDVQRRGERRTPSQ